jgi:5-dehydro-2-deoxygluconokinase
MDLYADPPGTEIEHAKQFTSALGGSAANIAVAISKLGGTTALLTVVSDDAVGRYVCNEMQRYGVDAEHVHVLTGQMRTSLAVVESRNENCQSIIYRNDAADFHLTPENVKSIDFSRYAALIVTGTSLAIEPSRAATLEAMAAAKMAGLSVILDVDYRPYSWRSAVEAAENYSRAAELSSIVIGNDVEFGVMAGTGDGLARARELAQSNSRIVVYKMGEKGAVTLTRSEEFTTSIFPVNPLKPTGAGDSFMGGFVTSLMNGFDLRMCVRRGSAAAAITVTRVGCAPALPTTVELDTFLKQHPAEI